MRDAGPQRILLATLLSALSGYVDATGFLATGGLFVSFMSGNSTRMSVALVEDQAAYGGLIFGVIFLFVLGVILGTATSRVFEPRKTGVLILVSSLLSIAALAHTAGVFYLSSAFMVLAMGAENAVFQRDGEVSIGLTYMTGTLVKLGQNLTSALFGGPRNTWWPYALHWASLVSGAALGARMHGVLRAYSLWPAVIAAIGLTVFSYRLHRSGKLTPAP